MGFNSQAGQIGFGLQTVKGTPVAATRFARIKSGGLGGDRPLLIPDPEIGGNRDIPTAYLGPVSFAGDLEFYPRMQMFALLAKAALGASASSGSGISTHVITPADDIPWITVEERIGTAFESFRYSDCKVDKLHLEADAGGYLMGSASIMGIKGESGFTAQATPAIDETPLVVGSSVTFTIGGVNLKGKSFSLDIMNNIESDDFRLGSVFMEDAVPKRREGKMTASYRPEDSTLWKQAMWGSSSSTVPLAGPAYRGPAQINISTYEFISGSTPYSIVIDIPQAVIAPFKITPSGDDIIGTDIELTMIRPAAATPLCTITVINNLATVS